MSPVVAGCPGNFPADTDNAKLSIGRELQYNQQKLIAISPYCEIRREIPN